MAEIPAWLTATAIAVLGFLNGWLLVLYNRSYDDRKALHSRVDVVEKDHAGFREKVARDYVSRDAMHELEERLVTAIDKLVDRFDRYFDKAK